MHHSYARSLRARASPGVLTACSASRMSTHTLRSSSLPLNQTDDVQITATCIRVPIMRAHAESINLTFKGTLTEEQAIEALSSARGVSIINDRISNLFPTPLDASNKDDVYVGRMRADISQPPGKGLELFVCGDQIRKGAALNAIQICVRPLNCSFWALLLASSICSLICLLYRSCSSARFR